MNRDFNESTKRLATALNTAATSCFTVGIATPVAGDIDDIGRLRTTLRAWSLGLGVTGRLLAATIVIGYVAVRLQEGAGRRYDAAA